MRKIVAMILVVMMVFVTPVNMIAANHDGEHDHFLEGECCSSYEVSEDNIESRGIGCLFGFHDEITEIISVGTHCIEFGDSTCLYNCYEVVSCTKCGEELSNTYLHYHVECHRYASGCTG